MSSDSKIIEIENLVVEYGKGAKKNRAVKGISFTVEKGECVGFIGANGAGKSTTMKAMMGFLFPTSGSVRMFGKTSHDASSRQRIGYLPEVALYYPFMKARELLELYGGLHGMSRKELKQKIPAVLEKVGLNGKAEILLKNFSKGMQQRLGIAQAIIADPEALIFDELSSGLDPVGRFDLREVIQELREQGRTVFFSSHELSEVESLCDRVIMIHQGKIVTESTVDELMKPLNIFQIEFSISSSDNIPEVVASYVPVLSGDVYHVEINDVRDYAKAIEGLNTSGATIINTESKSRSLEQYFIDIVRETESAGSAS